MMNRYALKKGLWRFGWLIVFLTSNLMAQTIVRPPKFLPEASWVVARSVDFNAKVPQGQISHGMHHLLSDTQVRISQTTRETYIRLATRVYNERGLAPASQIEMRFDPSYQSLVIHSIDVVRDGQRLAKLKPSDIKLLRRERDLDLQIFDGAVSATVSLEDIRVGDVIDYSYTIIGHNPVFPKHHAGRFDLQWSVPVALAFASIEVPTARQIHWRGVNDSSTPNIIEAGATRRYEWSARETDALTMEVDTPGWYDPYRRVEWSEFSNWNAVAKWGSALYKSGDASTAIASVVERISSEHKTIAARAIAALRFVQTDIRYLSVAIGPGSYAPTKPDVVLKRRFGDCKDKSLLLVTLLHALGVPATPALVNTERQRGVRDALASPLAFNHVLVRAHLPGRSLWLDPTQSLQGGNVDTISQPDYGVALVLSDETDSLTTMSVQSSERRSTRSIDATLDLRQGYEAPARYSVSTTYEGIAADNVRAAFQLSSRVDVQTRYRNFYDGYFPGIKAVGGIAFQDDLGSNRVVVTETYEIPAFWGFSEARKRREGAIRVPDIEWLLRAPSTVERRLPLAHAFPLEIKQTTQVLLPETFTIPTESHSVDDASFSFARRVERGREKELLLHDTFIAKADEVSPATIAAYSANLTKARASIDFALTRGGAGHDGGSTFLERVNWIIVALAGFFVVGWIGLAAKVYRYDPAPRHVEEGTAHSSLRGILLLLGAGIVIAVIRLCYGIWQSLPSYSIDVWLNFTSRSGDAYSPLWAPLLILELAGNIGLLVFLLLLAVLFLQRRSSFPRVYIAYAVCALLFLCADLAAMHAIPGFDENVIRETSVAVVRFAIIGLLWTIYLLRSNRVRLTFTRRYVAL